MPAGLLVTVPLPAPALETVSVGPIGTPVPVTRREIESPSAVKLTFTLESAVLVGVKRTITFATPPLFRLKGLPDRIVNGAATDAVPLTPSRLAVTWKVCSVKLPMLTLPKATVVVGVAAISGFARALTGVVHALAFPPVSTATTETK